MNRTATTHWTGHPFVDAGLAALAAAARVEHLEILTPVHLQHACDALQRVLLSDQALGVGVDKAFVRGALSQLFPNSELVNPSNWKGKTADEKAAYARGKFREALTTDLQRAQHCLQSDGGPEVCFTCGEARPDAAMVTVRKDKLPLLGGMVNFYPALAYGVRMCGLCALAVRFLPFSVLRTGAGNRIWLLHTQATEIAATIARTYGWEHFSGCMARNEALDFFGGWETAGSEGTVLYLLFTLLEQFAGQTRALYQHPRPTTGYLFSNDNRGGYVQALPVPHELMQFMQRLQIRSPSAYRRFWRELLQVPRGLQGQERRAREGFVASMARRIMDGGHLIAGCLDHDTPRLRGGWVGHCLYLQEVRKMAQEKLAILQRLGVAIGQSEDAKRLINELRTAAWHELYGVLLRFVRRDLLRHDEFYTLLPPNDTRAAGEIRDVVLAVAYEWQHCQDRGEEFPHQEFEAAELPPDVTLARIQQLGRRLLDALPNLSRWVSRLQTARSPDRIRGTYLNAVQHGAMRFDDFVFLAPLGDVQRHWLLRDYLLAYLFEQAREALATAETEEFEDATT